MKKRNEIFFLDISISKRHLKTAGWIFIFLWFVCMVIVVQNEALFKTLDTESANNIVTLLLLIPIGIVSLPLTYATDFSLYMTRKAASKVSKWERVFFSLSTTSVVLLMMWHFFIVFNFALYHQFNSSF